MIELAVTIAGWYEASIAALHVVSTPVVVPEFGLSSAGSIDEAGSVANHVVRRALCPVLTVRGQ